MHWTAVFLEEMCSILAYIFVCTTFSLLMVKNRLLHILTWPLSPAVSLNGDFGGSLLGLL